MMCTDNGLEDGRPRINLVQVSFSMSGGELDPEEVTRLLETEPAHAHRRGDKRLTKSGIEYEYHTGVWRVESRLSGVTDVDAHIEDLFGKMPRLESVVPGLLKSGVRCAIRVAVFFSGYCVGFGASPKTMRRLGEMGLELDILAYVEPDDDKEGEGAGNCECCQ